MYLNKKKLRENVKYNFNYFLGTYQLPNWIFLLLNNMNFTCFHVIKFNRLLNILLSGIVCIICKYYTDFLVIFLCSIWLHRLYIFNVIYTPIEYPQNCLYRIHRNFDLLFFTGFVFGCLKSNVPNTKIFFKKITKYL